MATMVDKHSAVTTAGLQSTTKGSPRADCGFKCTTLHQEIVSNGHYNLSLLNNGFSLSLFSCIFPIPLWFQKISILSPWMVNGSSEGRGGGANRRKFPRGWGCPYEEFRQRVRKFTKNIIVSKAHLVVIRHCRKKVIVWRKSNPTDESFCKRLFVICYFLFCH